jgi:hypothetical protein
MTKTNAACKSLKSAPVNRYHTQDEYTDGLFDQQDQVELTLKGTGCAGEATLKRGLSQLYKQNEKPMILEVFTPTRVNDKLLNDYFKALV